MVFEAILSSSDAIPFAQANRGRFCSVVFIFFTIVYQLNTLMFPSRTKHKSPVDGELRQVFS